MQRKLNAPKYKEELEGEFLRTSLDGTWLTQKAVDFLTSTLQPATQQRIVTVNAEAYEREIEALKQQLFDVQSKYTEYVATTSPLLIKASEQIALAEHSAENKEKAERLQAQNADLSAEIQQKDELLLEAEKKAQELSEELERVNNRGFFKRLFNK